MTVLVSSLSKAATTTVSFGYTTQSLVSAVTGGEVSPSEVRSEWIDEAMEEVDRKTGMCFRPVNFTEEIDGNGLIRVFARCFPVLEISQVDVDGATLPPSVYAVNNRTGSVTLKESSFPEGIRNIAITGVYGYDKLPPLIEKIATLIVAKTALAAKNGALVDSESIGDFTQSRTFKKLNDELDRAWEAWGQRFPMDFTR